MLVIEFSAAKSKSAVDPVTNLGRTVQPILAAGQEAWARLNHFQNWRDWKAVGEAVTIGRAESLAQVKAKRPAGRRYNTAFHDWLERYGFAGISKSTRARLLKCMGNIEAIEAWRETLSPDALLRFNHPGVVLREWKKATAKPDGDSKPATAAATAVPTLAEAQRLLDRMAVEDRKTLVGKVLRKHPDLVPLDLRDQLLRQHHRRDDLARGRIAKRAREITACSQHPEQHVEATRKAAAEILRAVEPTSRAKPPIATSSAQVGDLSAWPKAMCLD